MKAGELRIGNFVLDNLGGTLKIKGIQEDSDLSHISPVLLTEEWLRRFGFSENGFRQYSLLNWGMFAKRGMTDGFIINHGFFNQTSELVEVKYVHQLQNLYHQLASEELELAE